MNDSSESFSCTKLSTNQQEEIPIKDHFDFESSIDSYSTLFDKNKQNFTASSEISFVNLDDRTFTKQVSKTIINAFTGKPISPNPWRKLSTKSIQQQAQPYPIVPIQIRSETNQITTRLSPKYDDVCLFFQTCKFCLLFYSEI